VTANTRNVVIAVIGAIATISAAIIAANATAERKTETTISESGSEIQALLRDVAVLKRDILAAQAVQHSFTQSIAKSNVSRLRTFSDEYHSKRPSARELLNISGSGTLISGTVLGFYFKNTPNGDNYTVQIDVDGHSFKYPAATQRAYAQSTGGGNTGVLVLPPIRYMQSIRVTYAYPGGERYVAAHATVLPD